MITVRKDSTIETSRPSNPIIKAKYLAADPKQENIGLKKGFSSPNSVLSYYE